MAISTTALLIASTIVQVVGAISQCSAARQQAEFQAAVTRQQTERQAQIQEQQAARDIEVAAIDEENLRRKQRRDFAQRRAALGAAGIQLATGTPLLTAANFAAEAELQALMIRSGGVTTATRLRQEAELGRRAGITQSALTIAAGKSAQRRGVFRAGSSLLTGLGTIFKPKPIPGPEPEPKPGKRKPRR